MALTLVNSPGDPSLDNKFSVWFQGSAILYTIDDQGVWNTQNPDWNPDEDQFFGETHYPGDQTPGDTNHHLDVHGMSRLYSGSWLDVNAQNNRVNSSTDGTGIWADAPHFHIWDVRYSNLP